ncbi:MAG: carboxypeptidase regulatory-like domain-containing protein [Bacteroidales bacterium]|nr:carboxypeptidase regulatory-like domain-containing protein [Bacteroidales bacterium]
MKTRITGTITFIFLLVISPIWLGCSEDNDKLGSIYGYVTDISTGDGVPKANVTLLPNGESTLTGFDGRYEFLDLEDDSYSIKVSKAEYTDLVDPYTIKVKNGKNMRRDVQITKLPTSLQITNSNGEAINTLDFGADVSVTSMTFKIFNNGTVPVSCHIEHSCNWIASISSLPSTITSGQTVPVNICINRTRLAAGLNSTILAIKTRNGSAELTVKATSSSGNPPDVQIYQPTAITASTAQCEGRILNTNGGTITNCGFCYSTYPNPTLNDNVVNLGPSSGNFHYTLTGLEHNTTYHIRAFATSNLGTGYSSDIAFSTMSCIPVCGATIVENLDPTSSMGYSEVSNGNGCPIIDKGLCWSRNHTPTINDSRVSSGAGEGTISGMLYPLQPSTAYRVRSYATNEFGTIYGPERTFTTLSGIPIVTTSSASIVNNYYGQYIQTGGNVTDDAGTAVYEKGVCYGTSPNPNISSSFAQTSDGYGTGAYTSLIPLPETSGYIYIRAYATTRYGTGYGNQVQIYIP